ncbi:MAG: T9SS type A sorting domain-containing protein [Bacteroidota bacterium]
MKRIIQAHALVVLMLLFCVADAQVNMQGCQSEWGTTTYVLNNTGTITDGGIIRNTTETTPIDGAQACLGFGFGFCEMRIRWSTANSRWEVDLTDGASFFNMYYNTSASRPNPPDLTLGSWVENTAITGSSCGTGLTIMSGDVQNSVILPVSWADFTAEVQRNQVQLQWSTWEETNNDRFEVERSVDGETYFSIGIVDAIGNSNVTNSYSFVDFQPAFGESQYRIKQIDQDGAFSFSKVRSVLMQDISLQLQSISTNQLAVRYPFEAGTQIRILDLQGRMLMTRQIGQKKAVAEISVASIPAGVYIIQVQGRNGVLAQRWIKS